MARPFFNEIGFSGPEIFGVTKSFGVRRRPSWAALAGGVWCARYGLFKALLIGGILQAVTNLAVRLAGAGRPRHRRADHRHQRRQFHRRAWAASPSSATCRASAPPAWHGTQYALLTSLMAFGRTTLSAGRRLDRAPQTGHWTTFWIADHAAGDPRPAAAAVAVAPRRKKKPLLRGEGGAVNRRRGVNRAGGTCPFRSGAWGAGRERASSV